MSDTVIFRGAYIRSFEFRNGDGDKHTRIQFSADWTEPVRRAMAWGECAEGFAAADLVGRLAASHVILTPSPRELKQHELQIDAEEVSGFNIVPLKDSEGGLTGRELRFAVKTTSADAEALLAAYCRTVGRGLAQLKISYVKQEEMALEEAAEQ